MSFLLSRNLNAIAQYSFGASVTIFTLHRSDSSGHGLSGCDPRVLRSVLKALSDSNALFLSVDELFEQRESLIHDNRLKVCFTLDDGYQDQVEKLVPVLLEFNAKPTIFVISDFVDKKATPWDAKLTYLLNHSAKNSAQVSIGGELLDLHFDSHEALKNTRHIVLESASKLNKAQIEQLLKELENLLEIKLPEGELSGFEGTDWQTLASLEQQGLRVGSHTTAHHPLASLTDAQAKEQMTAAKLKLDEKIENPSKVFCYPIGKLNDFGEREIALAKETGYIGALASYSERATIKNINKDPFSVPRYGFPQTKSKALRYVSWIELMRSVMPV